MTDCRDDHPPIGARRNALVLRPEQHRATRLLMHLRARDFRATVVARADDALEAIECLPWLAMLVIEAPLDLQAYWSVVETVRANHPELPIFWIRPGRMDDDLPLPGSAVAFVDRRELIATAEALTTTRAYSRFLIDTVTHATVETMRDQFRTEAELLAVSLKLTRSALAGIVPMLPLGGAGLSGHLLLNTVEAQLARVRDRILPRKAHLTLGDLGDLGGELLNQTAGRIKAGLRPFATLELGLPMVMTGKTLAGCALAAPTLLFDFAVPGGHLFLELSLTPLPAEQAAPPPAGEQLGAGELTFF